MTKKQTKKKKVPLGEAIQSTDEELDMLAIVTPEDIERAKQFAAKYASDLGKELLLGTDKTGSVDASEEPPVEDNG